MKRSKSIAVSTMIMSFMLMFGSVPVMGASDSSTGNSDLNALISKAKDENPSLALYDKKIAISKIAAARADDPADDETDYQKEMRLKVNPDRRDLELENLQWDRDVEEESVVLDTKKYYYQSIIDDKLIEIQNNKIARLSKAIEDKKLGIQVGTEAETSLINDQVNLSSAETTLLQLKNDKQDNSMKLNLNIDSSVSADHTFQMVDVPYEEYTVKDINGLAEDMSEDYHSIKSMKKELHLDIVEEGIAKDYDDGKNMLERAAYPNTDYKSYAETLSDTITNLEYTIDDEKRNINAKVRTDYNNILNLNNSVQDKQLEYQQALIQYNSEKAKLDVGMSTQSKCDEARENLDTAQWAYNQAKLDYLVSVEQFKIYVEDVI